MPTTPVPILYRHNGFPDWGIGSVLMERDGKLTIAFENAGTKVFPLAVVSKFLEPVKLDAAEAAALDEKLRSRKPASTAAKGKSGKKSAGAKMSAATFPTFEAQLKVFEALFPGGFPTQKFIAEERGVPGVTGKAGYKEYGIKLVKEELSAERFSSASPQELFDTAKRALQVTNIAHPLEAAIPFGAIAETDRPPLVAALKELLHGEGDYGARLEAFVNSVNLKDKQGKPKRVTWPLATLLPALSQPEEHVPVKPTIFASQSTMLGDPLAASQPVTGAAYEKFRQIALRTRDLLVKAGHAPRDLMDVYSFIYRTHDEQPK